MIHHPGWSMGWGMGWGMWFPPLLLILVVLLFYFLSDNRRRIRNGGHESAREILKRRYASGEITKEQFEEMKKDIF
jgi:putative membrane protein